MKVFNAPQYAFQMGKSTELAHRGESRISLLKRELAVAAFVNIVGAFNNSVIPVSLHEVVKNGERNTNM